MGVGWGPNGAREIISLAKTANKNFQTQSKSSPNGSHWLCQLQQWITKINTRAQDCPGFDRERNRAQSNDPSRHTIGDRQMLTEHYPVFDTCQNKVESFGFIYRGYLCKCSPTIHLKSTLWECQRKAPKHRPGSKFVYTRMINDYWNRQHTLITQEEEEEELENNGYCKNFYRYTGNETKNLRPRSGLMSATPRRNISHWCNNCTKNNCINLPMWTWMGKTNVLTDVYSLM